MSRERVGQDFVIVHRAETRDLQTPEEQLDAESQRIVDDAWDLYLDVAANEPDVDMQSLLELDDFDEEARDCMAEIVEECVSEDIYTWVDNPGQTPTTDKLKLIMAFLGIDETQPLRGDIPFSDYCLLLYVAYTKEQSRIALAASEEPTLDDVVQPDKPEWPSRPEADDLPASAPKPRILH